MPDPGPSREPSLQLKFPEGALPDPAPTGLVPFPWGV